MTYFCSLNQPRCKRSVMTANGPFQKKECQLSANKMCVFATEMCPLTAPEEGRCYLKKDAKQDVEAGCHCANEKPNPYSEWSKLPKAELPPCGRCSIGNDDKKKRRDKRKHGSKEQFCVEKPLNSPIVPSSTVKDINSKKGDNEFFDRPLAELKSPEMRQQIFGAAIEKKVEELKYTRKHLLVPPCSLSSPSALPCSSCLNLSLCLRPAPQKIGAYKTELTEHWLQCPFVRIKSMCGDLCICPEIPPLNEEYDICPFLKKRGETERDPFEKNEKRKNNALVLRPLTTPGEISSCTCPLIPNDCCFTQPRCLTHC